MEAEGYKLDEASVVNGFTASLQLDKPFLKAFFGIKGDRLPKLLKRALGVISPVKFEDDESPVQEEGG
jgi:hypothetical protein